ncbi:hypothetical protein KCU69_g26, partial [Aureobasidium melanogenum]
MNYLVELAAALRRLLKPRADRLCPIWKRKSNRKKVVGAGVLGWKKTASRQQSIGSEQTKRCKLDPNTFEIKLKSMKKLSARLMATRTQAITNRKSISTIALATTRHACDASASRACCLDLPTY